MKIVTNCRNRDQISGTRIIVDRNEHVTFCQTYNKIIKYLIIDLHDILSTLTILFDHFLNNFTFVQMTHIMDHLDELLVHITIVSTLAQ